MTTTTTTTTDFYFIASKLREIKNMYSNTLEMSFDQQERLVLEYFKLQGSKHNKLTPLRDACKYVLEKWSDGTSHDSTLIDETYSLLSYPFKKVLPTHGFDRYMLVYKIADAAIQQVFDEIPKLELSKIDRHIIKTLSRVVRNTFVDNPNFKGEIPYYKRNMRDFERSNKLSVELLDKDFDAYISYFEEEE